jgi:NAD(P)-dependent dehydrogenase (short-subunit alcohol dehydrogenase family)
VADGRTAVVTGASSGIGEAAVKRLLADGWRVLAVARREERLRALGGDYVAADLTAEDAPARVREAVEQRLGGRLDLLVNNAGSAERAAFADGGYANVRRTMDLNFDSQVRLTEALLPLLRASAPSAIVNVSSVAGRVASRKQGAYSASKFALAGWTEALALEEEPHGVHVGHVLPGFVATEGFPQAQLTRSARTRWIVSTPERVAQAIVDAGPGGRDERYVPRPYRIVPILRSLFPGLVRRGAARRA